MRNAELLTFNFTVPAGAFERFGVAGNYVRILSTDPAGAVLTLETFNQGRDGSKVPIATGRDVDLGDFTEIRLTNETGQAVEVEMIAGFGRYRSQELLGSVSVDGDVLTVPAIKTPAEALRLAQFFNSCVPQWMVHHALYNPENSGVDLLIKRLSLAGNSMENPQAPVEVLIGYKSKTVIESYSAGWGEAVSSWGPAVDPSYFPAGQAKAFGSSSQMLNTQLSSTANIGPTEVVHRVMPPLPINLSSVYFSEVIDFEEFLVIPQGQALVITMKSMGSESELEGCGLNSNIQFFEVPA